MASKKKRAAENQLTKDNHEDDGDDSIPEVQAKATAEQMANRKVITVKRTARSASTTAPAIPKGAFTLADDLNAGKDEKPVEKKDEKKAAPAPAAEAANPWAKFLPQPGSWDCPSCMLNNKKEATKCVSCLTPNPKAPAEEAPAEESGFTFGVAADSSSSSSSDSSSSSSSSSSASESSSSASSSSSSASTEGSGFSFSADYSFNSSEKISFDSAGAGSDFASSSADSGASADSGDSAAVFVKRAESTGEEKDQTLYKVRAKVYIFKKVPKITKESVMPKDDDDGTAAPAPVEEKKAEGEEKVEYEQKYVEAGVGDLKVNKFTKADGKIGGRLVLRVEKILSLALNAPLFVGMNFSMQNDQNIRFCSTGLEGKMEVHLLKFKLPEEAATVFKHMESLINEIKNQ